MIVHTALAAKPRWLFAKITKRFWKHHVMI